MDSQPDTELEVESLDDIAAGMDEAESQEEEVDTGEEQEVEADDEQENEQDDDPEQEDEGAEPDDEELTFEVDGKPVTLKKSQLPEVWRGQMFEADYRKKTAELGEQRRSVEAMRQQIEQERNNAASQLDVLIDGLYRQLVGDQHSLSKLIEEDPQEYLRQQNLINQRSRMLQDAYAQRQALAQRQQADEQAKQDEWRKSEGLRLLEKLPEWRDKAKAQAEQQEIAEYLSDLGYTSEELGGLVDHRALLVARDAAAYRRQQAAKAKREKEQPRKPIRSGTASNTHDNSARVTAAKERLKRNPDSLDALTALAMERGI